VFKKFVVCLCLLAVTLLLSACGGKVQLPNEYVTIAAENLGQSYEKPKEYMFNQPGGQIKRFMEGDIVPWKISNTIGQNKNDGSLGSNFPDYTINQLIASVGDADPLKGKAVDKMRIRYHAFGPTLYKNKADYDLIKRLEAKEVAYVKEDRGYSEKYKGWVVDWQIAQVSQLYRWDEETDLSDYFNPAYNYDVYMTEWKYGGAFIDTMEIKDGYLKIDYEMQIARTPVFEYFYDANDPKAPQEKTVRKTAFFKPSKSTWRHSWEYVKSVDAAGN